VRKPKKLKPLVKGYLAAIKKLKALEVVKENQYFTASEIKFC